MSNCTYLLSLLLTVYLFHKVYSSCSFQNGKYDLSALDRSAGWPVPGASVNGTLSYYEISLCRPLNYSSPLLKKGCSNSSVCLISNDSAISYGNAIEDISFYAISDNLNAGFSFYILTNTLCKADGKYRAAINFVCGPHLGSPELIFKTDCQANFYWRTSAACLVKPKNEVPCYILDDRGNKHDLTPLIKSEGGYDVITPNPNIDFIINICSNLILNDSHINCPDNSSACLISGKNSFSFGSLTDELKYTKEGLILSYKVSESITTFPPNCQLRPKTKILFKCPARGYSQPPKLISDYNCQYEVLWETEYACPENLLKGDIKACHFTNELHGVEIDLSPLKSKSFYNVSSSTSAANYFLVSVCRGLGNVKCDGKSWKSTSVCIYNSSNSLIGGSTDKAELIYADGAITLKYLKGGRCQDGMEQMTIINFICDLDDKGDKEPHHVGSHNCTHFLEWHTKYACLKYPLDIPCSVTFDKKTVNLEKLLITEGEPWEVNDYKHLKPNNEFFVNVCGQVRNVNLSNCGDASICVLNEKGEYLNLGKFVSPPTYDKTSNSTYLQYSEGSLCSENKTWTSSIEFICRPGHINSEPVLTDVNKIECSYKFEWQTAEACPVGLIEGSNCQVRDSSLGIDYDLTPLKPKIYKIESDSYDFYIGVCRSIFPTPCSKNSQNVGVCQIDKNSNNSWKTGEPTSRLSYMDGVINLTYMSGDPYNDQKRTARSTVIIFICKYNAGHGNPQFIEEVNYVYVFHWYTTLVCPPPPSPECIAHDPFTHLTYDLSGLASSNDWKTVIKEDNKRREIFLNVCHSLRNPYDCNPTAAACIVERNEIGEPTAIISNLGRAVSRPVLENPGHLSLTYVNGDPCVAFGENVTYSTIIHFLCAEDEFSQHGLRFLNKVGACQYSLLWTTEAACPVEHFPSKESCQLTDPDSGFTFDLTPLQAKQPYIVPSPSGNNFHLNICGKVVNGCLTSDGKESSSNISVCEVGKDGKTISNIAVSDSYMLNYSTGSDLILSYKSASGNEDVIIKFPCLNTTADSNPKFLHHENGKYIFELLTPLTCMPMHFDCNIVDQFGNEYDFTPLSKYSGSNWEVSDTRTQYSHLKYHLNFCRPLNKVSSYKCPGGGSSACQTNVNNPEVIGYDLGSQMSDPMVSYKGTVVIRYTEGSACHGQFKRSTTINLFCSENEGELKFMGETPECEYVFSLDTPVACPIQSSKGSNCIVKDPLFGYIFDLNPLKSKNNNYNVTVKEYNYEFNVCDKLNGFSNECSNSSVCQLKPKDPNFAKSLGLPNSVLKYRKGLITLEYESGTGNCHGKYNRTTQITFICHHAHEDKDGPTFVAEAEDCTYLFEWPTVHACPPFDVIECSVTDSKGIHYDLSRLSLPNENYYVKNPMSYKKTFVINVCRSVVHTPNSLCPYTSAACLVDSSSSVEPINLGRVIQAPYIENEKIKISYSTGDPCDEENSHSARFMQTIIEFACDPNLIDSKPEFIGKDGCTYYFDWHTVYACPPNHTKNDGDCSVKDSLSGYLFNLSSLKNHGPYKFNDSKHQYYLNVCGNSSSNPCGTEAGMCQEEISGEKRYWTGGKLNLNLMYENKLLYLNYSNGDSCHGGSFQRNTLIEFHCGEGIGEPQFLYESHDCTYFFSWKTELACQTLMHCAIKNGSLYYNLIPLSETYYTASSNVVNDNASYYISVCNSLMGIPNVVCPPGSSICRVSKDSRTSLTISESLGKVEVPPFIDFVGHATAIYTNGSNCVKNPAFQNRARIIFLCDANAGKGEPVLLQISDECLYLFEWRTNLVCPEQPEVPSSYKSCNYTDNSKGIHFDLSPLQKTDTKPFYEVSHGNMSFILNICSSLQDTNMKQCGNAGICGQSGNIVYNYGVAASQKFTYDGRRLRLTFYDGDDCPSGMNGKRTSEIFFVCDPAAYMGQPILYKSYTCLVVFMWKTSLVCQNMQPQCAFDVDGKHYDFNLLSSLTHNWESPGIDKSKNVTYWINLCRGIQPSPQTMHCASTAAVCMSTNDGIHLSLGMIQTMQVKSINSTDLLLVFKNGDPSACMTINSASNLQPVTRIFMRCGTSLGQPRMFAGPDRECYFDFVWESSLACADRAEEIMMEKDGIIKDKRLEFSFDINDILNKTFIAEDNSTNENYIYKINLSGGVSSNTSDPRSTCAKAAICQTKPNSPFERDIGSLSTRTFILRGSELHLEFKSLTRPCGKNPAKEVRTLINMQCVSAASYGSPKFIYESGNCDYLFEWPTVVVCPDYHRRTHGGENGPKTDPYQDASHSSHKAEIAVGIIFGVLAALIVIFILVKPERRAIISSRFRSLFGRVSLPYFQYKRPDGERLVLVDASQAIYDDDEMLRC